MGKSLRLPRSFRSTTRVLATAALIHLSLLTHASVHGSDAERNLVMSLFWNYVISSICHGLECLLQIAPIFLTLGFMMLLQRVRSLEDELERLRGAAAAGDNRARTISSGSGNDPGESIRSLLDGFSPIYLHLCSRSS